MGASHSSQTRSSGRRPSKVVVLRVIEATVQDIQVKIENGYENEDEDHYYSTLTETSTKVQQIRNQTTNKQSIQKCEDILKKINACLRLLEEKPSSRESNLDLGAVESNSFISQDLSKLGDRMNENRIRSLTQIEDQMNVLDQEIRKSVLNNDIKNLTILEKKVNILYKDLENVHPNQHTPAMEKKEKLAGKLIKFNNKITVVRRKSDVHVEKIDGKAFSKPTHSYISSDEYNLKQLSKIEQDLSDLEVVALTFEDTQNDVSYEEIKVKFKKHYATLEKFAFLSEPATKRVTEAKNVIKKNLHALTKKAKENEMVISKELGELLKVEKEITQLKAQVDTFAGTPEEATRLDQSLRGAWDKLNHINTYFDKVKLHREKIIKEIQSILKSLNEKARDDYSIVLLRQAESFKSSWYTLRDKIIGNIDKDIYHVLEEVQASIGKSLQRKDKPDLVAYEDRITKAYSTEIMDQLVNELANDAKVQRQSYRLSADAINFTPIASSSKQSLNERQVELKQLHRDEAIYSNSLAELQLFMEVLQQIDRIKNAIVEIQNSVLNFVGTTDSEAYEQIETQLMLHKGELESMKDYNKDITENKQKTLEKLQQVVSSLRDKAEANDLIRTAENRRSTTSDKRRSIRSANTLLGNIMTIDANVHTLDKQIKNFGGTPEDNEYKSIHTALNENKVLLEGIDALHHENIKLSKLDVLQHIDRLQLELTTKASEREIPDDETKLKEILKLVKSVDKKIRSFYGTYRNMQYLQLENSLNLALSDLEIIKDGNPRLGDAKKRTKEKIQKLLRALDERSVKPQPQRQSQRLIEKIQFSLENIKSRMETFTGNKDENYFTIMSDLSNCNDDIKSLSDDGGPTKIEYLKYVDSLFTYMDEKVASTMATLPKPNEQVSLQELHEIEDEFNKLQPEIANFKGNTEDTLELDEALIALMLKCDKVNTFRQPVIQERRKLIMHKLNEFVDILEAKGKEGDDPGVIPNKPVIFTELEEIKKELEILNESIRHFSGLKNDPHHAQLDESLIKLFLRLDHIDSTGDAAIKTAKQKVLKEIQRNMKLLDEKVNRPPSPQSYNSDEGTRV